MTRSRDVADTQENLGGAVPPFVAGKNKIINGDFAINQRAFTTTTTTATYTFDRWLTSLSDGTVTYSTQAFTPGAAPVAGYEATNFIRIVTSGQTLSSARSVIQQRIEDVRTLAGQTATVSFWAKAATGTPFVATTFQQIFGSGGSTTVNLTGQKTAITTSWARYSFTFSVPSISGATIGTGSFIQARIFTSGGSDEATQNASMGIQSNTFDIWGVQVESGSVATPFTTASGSIGGELALCQRYYYKANLYQTGFGASTTDTNRRQWIQFPVTMRRTPASYSATADAGTVTSDQGTPMGFRTYSAIGNTTTVVYFGTVEASAEL